MTQTGYSMSTRSRQGLPHPLNQAWRDRSQSSDRTNAAECDLPQAATNASTNPTQDAPRRGQDGSGAGRVDRSASILAEVVALLIALAAVAFLQWWAQHRHIEDHVEAAIAASA